MKKIEISLTPISEKKEFTKWGELFTQVDYNPETGLYLYSRSKPNKDEEIKVSSWEVVKGKPHKNPDGSTILAYPGTNDWGKWGKSFKLEPNARLCFNLGFEKWNIRHVQRFFI